MRLSIKDNSKAFTCTHGPPLTNNSLQYVSHKSDVWLLGNEEKEGDIRLVGISDFLERQIYGRVEIFLSGVWGTVYANSNEAEVVCRQLGYNPYGNFILCCRHKTIIIEILDEFQMQGTHAVHGLGKELVQFN